MEHISKQEQRPKEGYLTKQSAIEAMHVMEYKYKEPFRFYKCSVCGKFHIGRVNGGKRMDEEKKEIEMPRTKKDLKNKVIMDNTERILKEEVV